MLCVRHNIEMLFSLQLVIVANISPIHAHELIIARDKDELWHVFEEIKVVYWIDYFQSFLESWTIEVYCDVSFNIITESKGPSSIRLPLSM